MVRIKFLSKFLLKRGIIEIEVKTMEKEEVKIASEVASSKGWYQER